MVVGIYKVARLTDWLHPVLSSFLLKFLMYKHTHTKTHVRIDARMGTHHGAALLTTTLAVLGQPYVYLDHAVFPNT